MILRTVNKASRRQANILCGVGAAGSAGAIELVVIVQREGVTGLLLPMPYFFSYQQEGLGFFLQDGNRGDG